MDGMKVYKNRQEAKDSGVRGAKYHGKPCIHCQNTLRWASTTGCYECTKKKTREANNIRRKDPKTRPAMLESQRKANLKRRDDPVYKQQKRDWAKANPKKTRAGKRAAKAKRRTNQKNNPLPIGWEESKPELRNAFDAVAVRLEQETGIKYHLDHIIPISKGGPEHELNFQLLTDKDNLRKSDKMPDVTFEELAQIPPTPEHRIGLFIL